MPTISTINTTEKTANLYRVVSNRAQHVDVIDLDGLDYEYAHVLASIQMVDSQGALVTGSGTFTFEVYTSVCQYPENPPERTIDASSPDTISWSGGTQRVRIVGSGLSGFDAWNVCIEARPQ